MRTQYKIDKYTLKRLRKIVKDYVRYCDKNHIGSGERFRGTAAMKNMLINYTLPELPDNISRSITNWAFFFFLLEYEVFVNKPSFVNWVMLGDGKSIRPRFRESARTNDREGEQSFRQFSKVSAFYEEVYDLKHFYSYPEEVGIRDFKIIGYNGEKPLFQVFNDMIRKYQKKKGKESDRKIGVDEELDSEVLFITSDGKFAWVDLNSFESDIESRAMQHCGSDSNGDTLLSLREIFRDGKGGISHYIPRVTITLSKEDKMILQSKGFRNSKPSKKYHKYIIELFKEKIVDGILLGSSYMPFNDFYFTDMSEECINDLLKYRPHLIHTDKFLEHYVKKDVREAFVYVDGDTNVWFNSKGEPEYYEFNQLDDLYLPDPFLPMNEHYNCRVNLHPSIRCLIRNENRPDPNNALGEGVFKFGFSTKKCTYFYNSYGVQFWFKGFDFVKCNNEGYDDLILDSGDPKIPVVKQECEDCLIHFWAFYENGEPVRGENPFFVAKLREAGRLNEKNHYIGVEKWYAGREDGLIKEFVYYPRQIICSTYKVEEPHDFKRIVTYGNGTVNQSRYSDHICEEYMYMSHMHGLFTFRSPRNEYPKNVMQRRIFTEKNTIM